jgi:hypothetical protein
MLHAILHKGKLVGLFSDYQKCKVMFEGLISNNFADRKNLEIKSYYENSITTGEYNEDNDDNESNYNSSNLLEEFTDNNTTDTPKKETIKQQINNRIGNPSIINGI